MANRNRIVPGILLILIGLWALLESLHVTWIRMEVFWPAILMAAGTLGIYSGLRRDPRDPGAVWLGVFALLAGGVFLYVTLGDRWSDMAFLWPVFPLIAGVAWGVAWLLDMRQVSNLVTGAVALLFGIGGLLYTVGRLAPAWGQALATYWPLILVVFGAGVRDTVSGPALLTCYWASMPAGDGSAAHRHGELFALPDPRPHRRPWRTPIAALFQRCAGGGGCSRNRQRLEWGVIPAPRLWTHLRLADEVRRHPPDVLFVPAHVPAAPPSALLRGHGARPGLSLLSAAHTRRARLYLEWATRFNAREARRVLVDSEATRDDLARLYGVDPARMVVAYPAGVDDLAPVTNPAILATMRERYGIAGPYLAYVGTLQPRKNLASLLRAFGELVAAGRVAADVQLVLAAGRVGWPMRS